MSQPRETYKEIVVYPAMPEADYEWIEALRQTHHHSPPYPIKNIKRPFFVFHQGRPIDTNMFIQNATKHLQDFYAFNFTIHYCVIIGVEYGYSINLVPMLGLNEFLRLQSIIHFNILNKLNFYALMPPYIHIAWVKCLSEAKARMNRINQHEIKIRGRIDKLSLKEFKNRETHIIHEFHLNSRPYP